MPDPEREDRIRREAYRLWEEDGCSDGRDACHWQQAEQHIRRLDNLRAEIEAVEKAHRPPVE